MSCRSYCRGKLVVSARIVFLRDDKALLGLRINAHYAKGKWMLPGGSTEKHETALYSAIREAREEVGILVDRQDLQFVGMVHWYKASKDADGVTFNWSCKKWSYVNNDQAEPTNCETHKCSEIRWFAKEEIEKLQQDCLIESTSYSLLHQLFQGNQCVYAQCDWPTEFNT